MHPFRALLILSFIVGISGCTTVSYVQFKNPPIANTQPPLLIPNQDLLVYGDGFDVLAWEKAGLFRTVTRTKSKTPPDQGAYARIACENSRYYGHSNPMLALVAVLTIGLLPSGNYLLDTNCEATLYQDGVHLGSTQITGVTTIHVNILIAGFFNLPYTLTNNDARLSNSAQLSNGLVIGLLNNLPRENK